MTGGEARAHVDMTCPHFRGRADKTDALIGGLAVQVQPVRDERLSIAKSPGFAAPVYRNVMPRFCVSHQSARGRSYQSSKVGPADHGMNRLALRNPRL